MIDVYCCLTVVIWDKLPAATITSYTAKNLAAINVIIVYTNLKKRYQSRFKTLLNKHNIISF